jgi:hypothetical protein
VTARRRARRDIALEQARAHRLDQGGWMPPLDLHYQDAKAATSSALERDALAFHDEHDPIELEAEAERIFGHQPAGSVTFAECLEAAVRVKRGGPLWVR